MATSYYATGERMKLSSTVTTAGATYVWEKDGVVIPSATTKDYEVVSFAASNVGTYKVTATVAEVPTATTFAVGHVTMTLTPEPIQTLSQEVGSAFTSTMTAVLKFVPIATSTEQADYKISSQWRFGSTNIAGAAGLSYTKTNLQVSDTGSYSIVNAIVEEGTNIIQTVVTKMVELTVTAPPVVLESLWKVVPLGYRHTSFTWVGYWVIDEIKKNSDWFTNYDSLKYKDEIETIVKAFNDFGEVDLMESRNGRILKVSDLK